MARPATPLSEEQKVEIAELLNKSRSAVELKAVQCLWLRANEGKTAKEIASSLGWSESNVKRVQADYLKRGTAALRREVSHHPRNYNLSREEESHLLREFASQAKEGNLVGIQAIHVRYEEKVGHSVPASTIYRMLKRHEWRSIQPRPKHPKGDEAAKEDFKKTSRGIESDCSFHVKAFSAYVPG